MNKPQYDGKSPLKVRITSDSDWASDKIDRKSQSGQVTFIEGCLVDWSSCKQTSVTTSSTEAEYNAVSESCKNALYFKSLLEEITQIELPMKVKIDNQGAMFIAENEVNNKRTKHIDIRFHAIRDWIKKGFFKLFYVSTEENMADLLTKPLGKIKVEKFRTMLGLLPLKPVKEAHD
jgi:hypothetical protein